MSPWRETANPVEIRCAGSGDADDIARIFMESAEYHARIDPERYAPPALETISARYCEELRDLSGSAVPRTIFVAELAGEIVGFVEAQLEQSPDLMHREMTYCHISEIAVSSRNQEQGIGTQLLRAAEDWGRDQGAQFASLEYHVANPSAARFYQRRMGYLPAATIAIKSI